MPKRKRGKEETPQLATSNMPVVDVRLTRRDAINAARNKNAENAKFVTPKRNASTNNNIFSEYNENSSEKEIRVPGRRTLKLGDKERKRLTSQLGNIFDKVAPSSTALEAIHSVNPNDAETNSNNKAKEDDQNSPSESNQGPSLQ